MSVISQFMAAGGGGKLRFQDFTSSGTFTPSAALLAKGGQVYYELIGGGSSGAVGYSGVAAIGGDAGVYKTGVITLTGAESVTIGAGGAAVSATATQTAGNAGSQSSIGSLATAAGGAAPPAPPGLGGGGRGAGGIGYFTTDTSYTLDARGGVGVNGLAGGGGGSTPYAATNYGPWHMQGCDGGGNGAYSSSGAAATATAGTANTGGGGGGASNDYSIGTKTSGAGGSGWCRIVWFE